MNKPEVVNTDEIDNDAHEAAQTVSATIPDDIVLTNPEYYVNEELSQLAFNRRVLLQALDETKPLLERLRFLLICARNLDEFFEVRVARVMHQAGYDAGSKGADGLTPSEALQRIGEACHELVGEQYQILNDVLLPALDAEKVRFIRRSEWTEKQTAWIKRYFHSEVLPVITPMALDPSHPLPRFVNKSLHFIATLNGKDAFGRSNGKAVVHAPRSLPQIIRLPDEMCEDGDNFIFLSSIIHAHAEDLFPGMEVEGWYQFRITRNSELFVDEESVDDLANALKGELQSRNFGHAVRLEIASNCPENLLQFFLKRFDLSERELYRIDGTISLDRLMSVPELVNRPDLRYPPFVANIPDNFQQGKLIFDSIAADDILLNHPYQSFKPVVDFINQAALDPSVMSIKQTLYRTGANSQIVNALIEAARNGKEVSVVVELRARFDEQDNIMLAERLQEAGVLVVYGVVGYKTHAKMTLVVRREGRKLVRYAHLGTGNYHAVTANFYTDYGLLTCDKDICEDVHKVFLQLTGMGRTFRLKKLLHAPFTLYKNIMSMIKQETDNAKQGKTARIIFKMNGLTEPSIIEALYEASQAGVKVDLIVRGMCCLRPGIQFVSENIKVRSIIGRFLEHTRVYYFYNDGEEKLFLGSADLMQRNLHRRVEICFPIEDKRLMTRIKREGLQVYLEDNCQSWQMQSDGSYRLSKPTRREPKAAQMVLLERLTGNSFS